MFQSSIFSLVIVVVLASVPCHAQTKIRLCNHLVQTQAPIVSLGDVATVEGTDVRVRRQLESIEIGKLDNPEPEQVYQLSKKEVALSLRLAGLNREAYQVTGPETVQVAYVSELHVVTRLESNIQNWLAETYGIEPADLQVTIQPTFRLADDFKLPQTPQFVPLNSSNLPLGRQNITLSVPNFGQARKNPQTIPVVVELMREVAVAARNITKGSQISAADIRMVKRPFTAANQTWFDATQVIGNYARQNIAKYTMIEAKLLQDQNTREKTIKKNQLIEAVLNQGSFQIKLVNVRALQSGNEGESIEIVSLLTNRRFRATVAGPGSVLIK